MKSIKLAYGKQGLHLELDEGWNVCVVEPEFVPGLSDPLEALQAALRKPIGAPPLAELVRPGSRIGIIVNDITRATPSPLMLKAILNALMCIPDKDITLFIALGTHRPNTEAELSAMLGADMVERFRIVQNNAFDAATQVCLGMTSRGHEIWVNRELMDCQLKILTGFIEPHLFAGFSGGGKALMPGMCGLTTVLGNHGWENLAHPQATWGVTRGNPLWEEIHEIAVRAEASFLLNVTLNREKQITGVFAGDLHQAHAQGCDFVRQTAMVAVDEAFDIIVTTNSGYPLDLNLYQSVKGMSAAAQVVRPGGAILIATDCWDGVPEHGLYRQLLSEAGSPRDVLQQLQQPGFHKQDQWQVQIQAQIQLKADIFVHSANLRDQQIREALLIPAADLEATLARLVARYGAGARICILPEGPLTIPYIKTV